MRRAALLLAVLCIISACGRPPLDDMDAARSAMERAEAAEGVSRASAPCAAAREALVLAEAEVRLESRRRALSRDFEEAARLMSEARIAAEICAYQATVARARIRTRAGAAIKELTAVLPRVHALARHAWDADSAQAILQADVALGEAKRAFEKGEYERALEAAERGRSRLAGAVGELNRAFDALHSSPRRAVWRRWVKETLKESTATGKPVIIVDKLRRQLRLFKGKDEVASYRADLGLAGVATKTQAGDDATPEGRYRVTEVRGPGQTRYYRALMLDYPNAEDRERFRRLQRSGQVPKGKGIGSLIEIHGNGGRSQDWTQGCVALENDEMDDLVPRVKVGTAVTIVGTIPEEVVP
ncbi:MAG TPA: L,D-transpeptidase family protein [Candidatus Polarisedimenticolia bacterium]|nr:L,D-transpeptidase family protein [Candidatus Polarisedimenticolia bacterium]